MINKGKNVVAKYLAHRVLDEALVTDVPAEDLELILVVPCFKEKLSDLLALCESLEKQSIKNTFELIIVVNNPIDQVDAFNLNQIILSNKGRFSKFTFKIHFIDKTNIIQLKKAGVGLARKVGLDEGLRRFDTLRKNGLLICLDADCIVAPDYIEEILEFFRTNIKLSACSIGFKHRFEEILDKEVLNAILQYELHLRYYIQIQAWINLPFAFQTVGSAMAVRSEAYAAQGGMPVLKAGEDFYFLHKFIKTNQCGNVDRPLVFPSGRISDRVPFGTGRAVGELVQGENIFASYNPKSFVQLRESLDIIIEAYPKSEKICASITNNSVDFFKGINLENKLKECIENTTDKASFLKRFYQWFDAFQLMKYVHFMRDHFYENIPILEAVNDFFEMSNRPKSKDIHTALVRLQKLDYPEMAE